MSRLKSFCCLEGVEKENGDENPRARTGCNESSAFKAVPALGAEARKFSTCDEAEAKNSPLNVLEEAEGLKSGLSHEDSDFFGGFMPVKKSFAGSRKQVQVQIKKSLFERAFGNQEPLIEDNEATEEVHCEWKEPKKIHKARKKSGGECKSVKTKGAQKKEKVLNGDLSRRKSKPLIHKYRQPIMFLTGLMLMIFGIMFCAQLSGAAFITFFSGLMMINKSKPRRNYWKRSQRLWLWRISRRRNFVIDINKIMRWRMGANEDAEPQLINVQTEAEAEELIQAVVDESGKGLEVNFDYLEGLKGGGRRKTTSRKNTCGRKSQSVSVAVEEPKKRPGRPKKVIEQAESEDSDEPASKRPRRGETHNDVEVEETPNIITIEMLLGEHYNQLRNRKIGGVVESSVSIDGRMLGHVSDPSWMIEVSVITARVLQLFKDYYALAEVEENTSVSMISPLYFHHGVDKKYVEEFFLTDYRRSDMVIVPIFHNQHFTLAIQTVKNGRKGPTAVECKYYDSFRNDAPSAIKEKLQFIARTLHPNIAYTYENRSIECDEQLDFVNCGAFMVENLKSYFDQGQIQETDLSGYQKRMNLLKAVAPLINYEFDEDEIQIDFDAYFAEQLTDLEENRVMAKDLDAAEYGIHLQDVQHLFCENMEVESEQSSEEELTQNSGMVLRNRKVVKKGAVSKKSRKAQNKQLERENMDVDDKRAADRKHQKSSRKKIADTQGDEALQKVRHAEYKKGRQTKKQKALGINGNVLEQPVDSMQLHYLGKMDVICTGCNAKHFPQEPRAKDGTFSSCCSNGKVILDESKNKPFPSLLEKLFTGAHEKSKFFIDNIRQINKSFAFGAPITKEIKNNGGGPFMYRQHGEFQRAFNCGELPDDIKDARYGQLYMIETDEAHGIRADINKNLMTEEELMKEIAVIMGKNAYAEAYSMLKDELEKAKKVALANNTTPPVIKVLFSIKKGADLRRENIPRTNEVAAIYIEGKNGEAPPSYIVANDKNGKLKMLSPLDEAVEPMLYPMFYPTGNKGWSCATIFGTNKKKVTLMQYVKYKIAIRDKVGGLFNALHYGGKLFQEWIVDQFLRVDLERLEYARKFVNEKIVAKYDSIAEFLRNKAEEIGAAIGKTVILPSTYIGSPRYMLEAYDDAMGMVRAFGKPDLFITMTCNPNWREILENLLPGQTAADRPDLVAIVFRLKYKAMVDYIIESKIFGGILAYVGTIEFQKRGLPHVHLLFTVDHKDKLNNPEQINQRIRAEIPDPVTEPRLHEVITRNNIHLCVKMKNKGKKISRYMPCCTPETYNPEGKCNKRFPKDYQDETELQTGGYANYRRRKNGPTFVTADKQVVDNRRVVPYCPQLSLAFNCHINVEHVADVDVVKYLHKYIFKGPDVAVIEKEFYDQDGVKKVLNYDEIKAHIKCRYLSAPEAAWRLFGYEIVIKSHHVEKLDLHLSGEQKVYIGANATDEEMQAAKDKKISKLMAFFKLNTALKEKFKKRPGHEMTKLRYLDMPRNFTWKPKEQKWTPRGGCFKTIGRIYSVSPKQHELFHLRLLLLNVGGPESFEALRTVDGVVHPTFKAACLALGLIKDDAEYRNAMREAAGYKMPAALRLMYAMLLIHCAPSNPQLLYDEFRQELSDDYIKKYGKELGIKIAYSKIEEILMKNESSFKAFEMENSVEIDETVLQANVGNELISDQELADNYRSKMNEDQLAILSEILQNVDDSSLSAKCKFIDGPGGSGKSFLFNGTYHILKNMSKKVICMAFTGCAADLLPNGRTIHSYFKLPLEIGPDSTSGIERGTMAEKVLKETDVFIVDEASMISKAILEIMDRTLKEITGNKSVPFGGKVMIFGGDFRQTLPIIVGATSEKLIQNIMKASDLWKSFKIFKLTKNMRANPNEIEFAKEILEFGEGKRNDKDDNLIVPDKYLFNGDLIREIFGTTINERNVDSLQNCAILAPTNNEVDEINKRALLLVEGESKTYYANDEILEQDSKKHRYVVELLNTINPSGIPKHAIELKKNSTIMLLRNLDIDSGIVNGTRMKIIEMHQFVLVCKVITGTKAGNIVFIPRITLECKKKLPVPFYRKQFPVRLAYGMTINKAQGQTLEKVGLKLDKVECFDHGMFYVGGSRAQEPDNLKIQLSKKAKKKTKNIVYKEVL